MPEYQIPDEQKRNRWELQRQQQGRRQQNQHAREEARVEPEPKEKIHPKTPPIPPHLRPPHNPISPPRHHPTTPMHLRSDLQKRRIQSYRFPGKTRTHRRLQRDAVIVRECFEIWVV